MPNDTSYKLNTAIILVIMPEKRDYNTGVNDVTKMF